MKKRLTVISVVILLLLAIGITVGIVVNNSTKTDGPALEELDGQETEAAAALRADLADPDVTDIEVNETIVLYSTAEVVGTKTITGGGYLKAASRTDSEEAFYILTLTDGADVTLEDVSIDGQNIAGGVHVKEGANLTVLSDAGVYYAVKEAANVLVEGECLLNGGSLLTAGGNNLINRGTTKIEDGVISGSGIAYEYAGVLNEGDLTMDGGSVEASRTNIVVKKDATFQFNAGTVSESIADGISVEKGGQMVMSSADALVEDAGISALYINGTLEITDATMKTSEETQLEIGSTGNVVIHHATITRGYADGIYNAGTLTIEDIEVSYVLENGIINRGELVMTGGSVHDNDGEGIYNRMGGTASITSSAVSIYNNHTGVVNYPDSTMELAYVKIYDNSAYSINNYGKLYAHDLTVSNSGSTSVYGNSGGYMELTRVVVNGTQNNHGVYLIGGSTIKMVNVTIKNTQARGITNVGGTLIGNNVTVSNAGTDGVANVTVAGTITIDGLKVSGSTDYNLQNAGSGSVMTISNAVLSETTSHNVRHSRGTMTLTNVTIDGVKLKENSSSSVHAIYSTGDKLIINNCTIQNIEDGRAVFNRGTDTEIKGLTCININGYAVANALGSDDWPGDGTVSIDGLVIKDPAASAILQETPGGTVTIKNSTLTSAGTNNIIVNNRGTMIIEDGVDMTCTGRAINNKGVMVINGGVIHDITPASSTMASALYNAGTMTINNCEVYNNTGTLKGVIGNVSVAYDYNQDGVNEKLYGTLTINGGKFYNNKVTGGNNSLYGGAVYIDAGTTASLLGGYFYNNDAGSYGNDIYNAGNLTVGNVVVGYDASGKAYTVDSMTGELYTTNALTFAGSRFGHSASNPLSLSLESLELGTAAVAVSSQMADTLKAGIKVNNMDDEWYLNYVDGSLLIWKEGMEPVCRIGNTTYYSLAAAVDSVGDGESATIEILTDVTLSGTINIGSDSVTKNITIIDDGSGSVKTISRGSNLTGRFFRVYEGSSLSLKTSKDSNAEADRFLVFDGTTSSETSDSQFIYVNKNGKVTINKGVVLQNNTTKSGGAVMNVAGTAVINGGVMKNNKTTGSYGGAFYVTGSLTIKGGTISENTAKNDGGAVYVYKTGKLTMTAGTLKNNKVGSVDNDIAVNAEGDVLDMQGSAYAEYIKLMVNSSDCAVNITGDLTTTQGNMTIVCAEETDGRVVIKDGSYTADDMALFQLAEDSACNLQLDGTQVILKEKERLVYLEENQTSYATIQQAVDAVEDGGTGTIVLKGDTSISSCVNLGDGTITKNITIKDDGTARTISRGSSNAGRFFRVYAGSSLTLISSSGNDATPLLKLDGGSTTNKDAQFIYSQGTVTINAGVVLQNNMNSTGAGAVMVNKGTVTMNGGLIQNNQTTTANGGAIYVAANGEFIMKGGSITGNKVASGKYGSGVYSLGKLKIQGGSITGNTVGNTASEDVCYSYTGSRLEMKGTAYVQNIRLSASCVIQVTGDLTTETAMAITCDDVAEDRVVIQAGAYTEANVAKFKMAEGSTFGLKLKDNGEYKEAVLYATSEPVYIQETGAYYATLSEAVDAVESGGTATIVLKGDVTITNLIELGDSKASVKKNITIKDDGSKRTISRGSSYTGRFFRVYPGCSLTFSTTANTDDNQLLVIDGAGNSGSEAAQFIYVAGSSSSVKGTITINAGVVFQNNTNPNGGGGVVCIAKYGEVIMNGGNLCNNTVKAQNGGAFLVQKNGSLTVNGGTITGNRVTSTNTSHNGGGICSQGTLTINGGTITGNLVRGASDDVYSTGTCTTSTSATIGTIVK